eukprot:s473_g17.t1
MVASLVGDWMKIEAAVMRAASGQIALVSSQPITRSDVVANCDIVGPVIDRLGLRPSIHTILEHVEVSCVMIEIPMACEDSGPADGSSDDPGDEPAPPAPDMGAGGEGTNFGDMASTEKMPAKPRFVSKPMGEVVEGDPKRKLFDPAILALKAAEEELECLKLEEAMYQELLAQEELEMELRVFEEEKSLLNRTIPASSHVAPSELYMANMDNLETLPFDPESAIAALPTPKENLSPAKSDIDPVLTLPTLKLGEVDEPPAPKLEVDRCEPPAPKSKQPETSTQDPSQTTEEVECKPKRPVILESLAPVAPCDQTGARGGGESEEGEGHDEVEVSSEGSDSEGAPKPKRKARSKAAGKAKSKPRPKGKAKAKAASTRKTKSEAKPSTEDKPKRKVRAKSVETAPETECPKGKRNADVSSETPLVPRNTRSRRAKAEEDAPTTTKAEPRSKPSKRSTNDTPRSSKAKKIDNQDAKQESKDKETLEREKKAMRSRKCCAYSKAYKMSSCGYSCASYDRVLQPGSRAFDILEPPGFLPPVLQTGAPAIATSTGVFVAGNAVEGLDSQTMEGENLRKGESTTSVETNQLESGWRYDEKVARSLARKDTMAYEPTAPTLEQTGSKGCVNEKGEGANNNSCPVDSKDQPAMDDGTETRPRPPPFPPMIVSSPEKKDPLLAEATLDAPTPKVDSLPEDAEEPALTPQETPGEPAPTPVETPQESDLETAAPGEEKPGEKPSSSKYDKWYHKIF